MKPTLLLATRSADKLREISQILAPLFRGRIITLHDAGIPPAPEEDLLEAFDTFLENAHAKAAFFLRIAGLPTLADDSGISVDALAGAPGVRSKRFAAAERVPAERLAADASERLAADASERLAAEASERLAADASERLDVPATERLGVDAANNERLLRELAHTPRPLRTAHYTCAAVLHLAGLPPRRFAALGVRSGLITTAPRGPHGFGYDPLFLDPATGLTFGETDPAVKNRTSHRARAFRALAANLPAAGLG